MPVIPFDHLTREERLTLIGELLRRLSTLEQDEKQSVSWETFRQELIRRYG